MIFASQTHQLAYKYGDFEKSVDMLIEAGYTGIDVSMFLYTFPPFSGDYKALAERLNKKAAAAGVKFVQAHAPFGGGREKYMAEHVPNLPRAIEFAGLLGIPHIVVHPIQDGRYVGNEERLYNMNIEFFRSLAPIANKHGVKIAIENMLQYHPVSKHSCDDIAASPDEICRMYDELEDTGAFTICLDIGHAALCGREPEDVIRRIGKKRLGGLHVQDTNYVNDLHTVPGAGKLNFDNICRALADIGYEGSITLEADSFYTGFPLDLYPEATRFMSAIARNLAERVEIYKAELKNNK